MDKEHKTMSFSPCDYVQRARDNQPKPLTFAAFNQMLDDIGVKMNCDKVREHGIDAERFKISLPAITWQSHFDGQLRTDRNAKPTGFFCLDVDIHHEDMFQTLLHDKGKDEAVAWAENEATFRAHRWADMQQAQDMYKGELIDPLGIVAIHISPSGMGVHVVAGTQPSCKTIEENQARLARLLGTSYDPVCKDWARIFFVTPRADWTYVDYLSLFDQ